MLSSTPTVKIEQDAVAKDDAKADAKKDDSTTESESSNIKTEATEAADDSAATGGPSAEDIAKEIGAAMVSLASKAPVAKPVVAPEDSKKDDVQVKIENKSSESEGESEAEGTKSVENKNTTSTNWDNSYTNELKKMYSDVDADTRAVAEEMIRAAQGGAKKPEGDSSKSKDSEKDKPKDGDSKKDGSKNGDVPKTTIAKGHEPSALELALKQQGITQSDQLRSTQFPFRLHNMLDDAERSAHAHIVSWCPSGDSFKIHKPNLLINVLQKYFRQSKFKSFLRQLQGYNFKRITRGKDQGVVSHPLFLRGRRSVSTLMRRKRVGPKPENDERAAKLAASFKKTTPSAAAKAPATRGSPTPPTRILPAPHTIASRPMPPAIHSAGVGGFLKPGILNPRPQDVLCVDYPNAHQVRQFQGNRKLASIVQKITGHYTSANESVRTMIVNEISSRIQNSGSRFLKLSKDGLSWVECNREEMFRKVISCFEQEILSKEKGQIDLTGESDAPTPAGIALDKRLPSSLHGAVVNADPARRMPPRGIDVVLRGGPGSEREGNTYLKTMIQANVGQQLDSFEMKRIKCRAILERMKRRGSRFFLKLKDTDTDDEMYILSDAEAQDVIYTAFCAEEKKVQAILVDAPVPAAGLNPANGLNPAANLLRAKALAGLDTGHPTLPGLGAPSAASQTLPGLGGPSRMAAAAALHTDAALLSQIRANNEMSLLASHNPLKRPLPGHLAAAAAHENIMEKRIRAETDEHIKLLIERERQRRDPYAAAAGLAGRLPFHAAAAARMEPSIPLSAAAFGGAGATANSTIDQYLKERRADELLLKQAAAARAPYAGVPAAAGLGADLPKSNNHFVEFLKKKYVKSAQERAW